MNGPERLKQVFLGVEFQDGIEAKQQAVKELAA